MKLNKMVCPTCGHEFFTDCAYGTCDACQTFFYASQSAGVNFDPGHEYEIHYSPYRIMTTAADIPYNPRREI